MHYNPKSQENNDGGKKYNVKNVDKHGDKGKSTVSG